MLVVKLVSAVDEDMELSMGCIPVEENEYEKVIQEVLTPNTNAKTQGHQQQWRPILLLEGHLSYKV